MLRLWQTYTRFLQAHPLKAQMMNTCVLMGVGDIVSQQVVEKAGLKNHNVIRTVRQASFGLIIGGPLLFTWFSTLDRLVKGAGTIRVLKMVAIDQSVMAPLFITTFFSYIGLTSGLSIQNVRDKLKKDFKTTLLTNYKVWPAVQLVNFYFVPLQHRVLAVNLVAVFWNTYLSWMANTPIEEGQKDTNDVSDAPLSETLQIDAPRS
ncbi:mitochondrial inner membrane protein Mpv17-like isoform X1 [Asterias amurensis]|uniref:mitochondrial inner membrane protein Mpv17-like isoform X1 n=1 Tax=Asterias amurensis TaxID=7602 RepID=UPI003AB4C396